MAKRVKIGATIDYQQKIVKIGPSIDYQQKKLKQEQVLTISKKRQNWNKY